MHIQSGTSVATLNPEELDGKGGTSGTVEVAAG